jgi:hypothetical protein
MSIATVELRAESGQIKAATQDLKNLEQQGVRTEAAANRVTNSSKQVDAAVGGMGRKAGQAGIQIQQLVGQVQGGVSPFVALSQQATDLGFVLGFPLAGAVAGIGAALIGTLIPSLFDSGDAVDELKQKILDLQDVAALTEAQRLFLIDEERAIVREKENQRAEAEEELRLIKIAIANQERLIGANERVTQARVESTKELNKQQATIDSLNAEIDDSNRKIEFYSKSQERSRKESERMLETQQKLTEQNDITATKLQEGELAALKLAAAYELGLNSAEQLPEAIALQVERAYELEQAEKAVTEAKRESEAQTRKLEQESKKAANEALRAAEAEIRKWEAAQQTARNTFAQLQDNLSVETADDPEIAKLEQQLEKRLELIDEYRLTKQADQAAADAAELAAFESLELQKTEVAKREAQARQQTQQQNIQAVGNFFGSMAQLAYQGGADSFETYKAFAIAQALISTYQGATAAYASLAPIPYVGPALGAAAAATAIGLGLMQVSAIRAQQPPARALGGQVVTGSSYLVGERGPELFTPSGGGGNITPFSQLMSEARQSNQSQAGTQNLSVNFAITANDSRGFDELLVKRRDLVYNMVQKALNDQGRRL